ncbi:MAG: UvrD-helicase domain-containing protein, partial [Erysipelotrichaceae bacterium]|nr:UvrD-helicase domain-containing protein [Erysipelotrichaceae bacterium]
MKYALVNGIILDGTREMKPLYGHSVLVDGEKIVDIIETGEEPEGYREIDLKGAYLLPGLINLHVHLASSGKPPRKEKKKPTNYKALAAVLTKSAIVRSVVKKMGAGYARQELMSGVTTIRTVGGILDFDSKVRDEINAGKIIGPRILAANMGISVPGGHFAGSIATESASVEEAVSDLRRIAAQKPDLIKLMITGGVMDASADGEPGVLRMALQHYDGATLLTAVPGSGKTTTLVSRLGYMTTVKGIDPTSILAMTYTKAAVKKMKDDFCSVFGNDIGNKISFMTIHKLCVEIIKAAGISGDICDEKIQKNIIAQNYYSINGIKPTPVDIITIQSEIAFIKNNMISESALDNYQWQVPDLVKIYSMYNAELKKKNMYDYDDLL